MKRNLQTMGLLGVIGALGLAIAGCGAPAVTHNSKPTPKATATTHTTKPSGGLTLAEASSPNFTLSFPLVSCGSLGVLGQNWESSGLLANSPVAECPPADFLTKWVPTVVPVTNEDPSHFTQAQADALGRALMVTFAWSNWAAYDDTPAVLTTIGQATGPDAPYLQNILAGFRMVGSVPGSAGYPSSISLVPLTGSEPGLMADPSASFALVVSYPQRGYSFNYEYPGKPLTTWKSGPRTPGIYDGALASSPELGTYFAVASFADNCSIGPVAGICAAAGAS